LTGIKRNIAKKVQHLLTQFPCVAIIGARQTGKTFVAQQLFPDWKYMDLEQIEEQQQVAYDPRFFFESYPSQVILDEAQEYPDLFKTLRGVIDQNREQKGRFIITGSSSPDLLKQISESLAGRVAVVELGTLKANEYYQKELSPFYQLFNQKLDRNQLVNGQAPLTREQMQFVWLHGGYAEPLLLNQDDYYDTWMSNYRQTYINRDIAGLFPRLNQEAFQRFFSMLGQLSSTIINKSALARAVQVSEPTINDYIDIADGTFIWRKQPSYTGNSCKTITKLPKGYMRDSGLLHFLLKIADYDSLLSHPMVGQSFEGFVCEELLKGLSACSVSNWDAYYYRTRNGAEIDLIIEGSFGLLPIKIKHGSSTSMKQLTSFKNFVTETAAPFGILINQHEEAGWLSPDIFRLPIGWL
jgi:uncharacterized protein